MAPQSSMEKPMEVYYVDELFVIDPYIYCHLHI